VDVTRPPARRRRKPVRRDGFPARAAQLLALSSFAVAQPLFDLLGKNPEFFAVRGSSSREIVTFALALTFVLPAVLLGAEALGSAAHPQLGRVAHLSFVGGLAALIALQAVKRAGLTGSVAIAAAAVLAAVGVVAYARTRVVPAVLTVLAPAALLFGVLFLFDSPVSKLVRPAEAKVRTETVASRTPVVLLFFDELSTVGLMDAQQQVDAKRFPNFADLARHSTWFRSARSDHPHSEQADPAILTGRFPQPDRLPIFADYPQNIFTLLGGTYDIEAVESVTHLCPPALCRKRRRHATGEPGDEAAAPEEESASLASDTGIVYLHLLLPNPYEGRLPPISDSWGDFSGHRESGKTQRQARRVEACARNICELTRRISATRKPTFYFVHSLLPHVPWLYLPSGRRYDNNYRLIPGAPEANWVDDDWLTVQGYQRYLLQLGYADRGLGLILRRLRSTGLFDRALIVLVADQGTSFLPGQPRRNVTPANLHEIAFIPLFVKRPHQRRPRVVDSPARTIDIVPTIADVLNVRMPWHVDGRSLFARGPRDRTVGLPDQDGEMVQADLGSLRRERSEELRRRVSIFGTGDFARVYRIGPHRELLGRKVAELSTRRGAGGHVELDGRSQLAAVDPGSGLVPTFITGKVDLSGQDLAIAVNGAVAAVTRSYTAFGETRFAAMIPETALRQGRNDVGVYAVRDSESGLVLEELAGSDVSFALAGSRGRPVIRSSRGETIPVEPRALSGRVQVTIKGGSVLFVGWAASLSARRPADKVIVLVDGRSVYAGDATNLNRKDIFERYGIEGAGFNFELPRLLLPGRGGHVRVLAAGGGVASELDYAAGYPWPVPRS